MFIWIIFLILILWETALTVLFWKMRHHYNTLSSGIDKKNLQQVLEETLQETHATRKQIQQLEKETKRLVTDSALHIQKIGLLRFNPFKDTGSDQSFIFALLDHNNSGIVISGLYARSGTRWYAKRVIRGKGSEHELSKEEMKAIDLAETPTLTND